MDSNAGFDILTKIEKERLKRGWSELDLARKSGLTQSTISTWRSRNLQPSISSLERICKGFGVSLSEFFRSEDEQTVHLTAEQIRLLHLWARLSSAERTAVINMLEVFSVK